MPRSHSLESPIAQAMPSITATEFAAWLLAPQSVGPCPWSIGHVDPSALQPRHRPHETDEAVAVILAIMDEVDS